MLYALQRHLLQTKHRFSNLLTPFMIAGDSHNSKVFIPSMTFSVLGLLRSNGLSTSRFFLSKDKISGKEYN